jgi:subtilisin family serine protease
MARWLATSLALALLAMPCIGSAREAVIDPAIAKALRSTSQVRVMVLFDAPEASVDDLRRKRAIADRAGQLLDRLAGTTVRVRHRYHRVPALALELDAAALEILSREPSVRRIDLDVGGTGHMLQAAPLAHVTEAFNAGLTGAGVKVAVIDSGIDTDHADFAARIVAQQCFCADVPGAVGCCPNGADTMSGPGSAEDDHGHGTNVSGILLGGGSVAQRGAAPAANLVSVKVLDENNSFCCASDVVAALDWVRQNHPDTRVLNASLGTNALFAGQCDAANSFTQALGLAVDNLAQNGTMVFVSSGNNGSSTSMGAPACVRNAIAVGAVWDANLGTQTILGCTETTAADKATCFTNSNAQVDLYAPGAAITSSGRGGGTSTFFGTSQAAPLTAGCAAVLRAAAPGATPAEIEAALEASPTTIVDAKNGMSFPRLDCAAAALVVLADIFADGFED